MCFAYLARHEESFRKGEINMEKDRFNICEVHICTFERPKDGFIKPMLNSFPTRWCVIDNKNLVAIDINLEAKYNYIPTCSGLYMLNNASRLIQENKRAAIFNYSTIYCDKKILEKGKEIIKKMNNGYEFVDGNEMFSNEEYLEILTEEELNKF